jgi:dihydrofolate synthase/folylpolyglutamate synthase
MGFYPRTHMVFGAMKDKDITAMFARLVPLADVWHFADLPTPRAATSVELETLFLQLPRPKTGSAVPVAHRHPTPHAALLAALGEADPADRIVVFGSFYTVGAVLEEGLPRRAAKHVG